MSTTPKKGFNKRPKFIKKTPTEEPNNFSENPEKRRPRNNTRDGVDANATFDLKKKRVYPEKGAFNNDNKKKSFNNVSEFDRQNRMKFSSRKDGDSGYKGGKEFESWKGYKGGDGNFNSRSIQKDGYNEERSRKKEYGRGSFSRGKERVGREEDVGRRVKSKGKTRERTVSTKRDVDDEFDTKFSSQAKPSDLGESGKFEKSAKKKLRSKKYEKEESLEDGPPKKKIKKAMRIARDDISSKKIDDGIAISFGSKGVEISFDGKTIEKTVDPDEKNEMSMNAQFRAIQPTPSILSFVEENLLGRRRSIDLRRAGYNIELSAPLDNIPLSTNTERERIEEAVFRNRLEFFAAAKVASSFPPAELPEIAFAGRSNVGKSSLLNALTRQWGVVRTSDKPGLTQTINFFKLGSKLNMVDLPGYGFAFAKEEVKDAWEELVKEYVSTRVGLKRVCLLIDTKWGMKPRDHELINLMERSQTKYQVVLTKTDLVFPIDVARRAMQIEESLKAHKSVVQPVMMISSKSGGGIRSLRTVLAMIARFAK